MKKIILAIILTCMIMTGNSGAETVESVITSIPTPTCTFTQSKVKLNSLSNVMIEKIKKIHDFTQDELKIWKLRREGKSITEISFIINMSTRTVDRHIQSIKLKIIDSIRWLK